jgi:disulfide bond formation protein DsbB
MALYVTVITILAVLTLAAVAFAGGLVFALGSSHARGRLVAWLGGLERHPIAWAAAVAAIAMTGSLYFSEVAHLAPCSLCWFQRIAMYPLVFVLGVGAVRADPGVWRYALPLALAGFLVAAYHVTIEWRPALDVGLCSTGVPCSVRYFAAFGVVSIATMSAAAFLLILSLLLLLRALERAGDEEGSEG